MKMYEWRRLLNGVGRAFTEILRSASRQGDDNLAKPYLIGALSVTASVLSHMRHTSDGSHMRHTSDDREHYLIQYANRRLQDIVFYTEGLID